MEAQMALDIYLDKMFAVIKQSNFDIAIGEFLLDLSVGTAVMMVQSGDDVNPINFIPVPQYLVAIEEGANGAVDNVYRRMRIKAEAIQRQWSDAEITGQLARLVEEKPTEEVELVEATIFDQKRGDYKVAGEIYGRGPVITALPDIKTLNKTKELLLKNAALAISGVYTAADDGVINPATIRIVAGAIIPVARNGGPQGESLKALPRSGDFNVSQLVINDLQQNIKRILLDESLPPDNMSARSATEVVERMKELSQNLGSAFGRLINETMIPLVEKILQVMDDRGLIDMPLRVNGLEVRVMPTSPLAMSQNMEEIQNIMQYAQIIAGFGQEAQFGLKKSEAMDMIAEKLGVPAKLRYSPEERAMEMQKAAQMAQQFAAANPEAAAQAVGKAVQGGGMV